jgi:hypothetical protein
MTRALAVFLVVLSAATCVAATTADVAKLVLERDAALVLDGVTKALADPRALTRATAARVAAVRDVKTAVPALRDAVSREADSAAAREELSAIALVGSDDDVTFALNAAEKRPASIDNAVALAIARRGATNALELYSSRLRTRPFGNRSEFFRTALWGHSELVPLAGSRLIGASDARGFDALLDMLRESRLAMPEPIIVASLSSRDEGVRFAAVGYLVHGYAHDPTKIGELTRTALAAPAETSSNREDFARVLLRRMLGGERTDDRRWTEWLETAEADDLLQNDDAVLTYLTDAEYAIRHNRCRSAADCALPEKRRTGPRALPAQPVAAPAFRLPDLLPAGLTHEIMSANRCRAEWIGVLPVTVDSAGRVQTAAVETLDTPRECRTALDEILRLSLATNGALDSPYTAPILVVKAKDVEPCLDASAAELVNAGRQVRSGVGEVKAPIVKRRAEPQFPLEARQEMSRLGGGNALLVIESVISTTGCVRSIRFLSQTPVPSLNAAAALALSKWTFVPGYLNGQPVEVIYNLTVNFRLD